MHKLDLIFWVGSPSLTFNNIYMHWFKLQTAILHVV